MKSVKILLLIFTVLQASPPPAPVRGDRFQIAVPQGWKVLNSGDDVILQHSSGASLLLLRATPAAHLEDFAEKQAERIMTHLGFAKLGDRRHYKNETTKWWQYEIDGTGLSKHG